MLSDHLTQDVVKVLWLKGNRNRKMRVVLGEGRECQRGDEVAIEPAEIGINKGLGEFAGAIGSEVEENDAVFGSDCSGCKAHRRNKFVRGAFGVGSLEDVDCRSPISFAIR